GNRGRRPLPGSVGDGDGALPRLPEEAGRALPLSGGGGIDGETDRAVLEQPPAQLLDGELDLQRRIRLPVELHVDLGHARLARLQEVRVPPPTLRRVAAVQSRQYAP